MFSCRSFASCDLPFKRHLLRQLSRRAASEQIVRPKRETNIKTRNEAPYQSTFDSFWDMIQKEKQDAKNYILIEDLCDSIRRQTPATLSRVLDAAVVDVEKYMIGKRCFSLIKLEDYAHFSRKTEPLQPDRSFPIRSRMLILRQFVKSETRNDLPVRDLTKGDAAASAMLKERDIEEAIDSLVSTTRMSRFGSKLRFFFLNQIEEVVCSGAFSDFHFLPFGSSVNGFGGDRSDLDMALDVRENLVPHRNTSQHLIYQSKPVMSERFQSQRLVDFVGDQLQYFVPGIVNLQRIPRARVPIVKVHSDLTDLDCDVSFQTARTSVRMAEVLFEYSLLDERVRKLVCFIKIWAKQHSLTNSNPGPWYTNFMLMMMIIHFFQTRPGFRLPAMNKLKTRQSEIVCEDEDISFVTIVREFFEFISSFDYESKGISILNGRTILKPSHSPIHIENPLEPDLNVCVNVQQSEVRRLVTAANTSLAIMVDSSLFTLSDLCKATTKPTVTSFNGKHIRGVKVYEFLTDK